MTATAILFFCLGATVLWGGLATTLTLAIKNERYQ